MTRPIKLFCSCKDEKHLFCRDPFQIIDSLRTAKQELNYSNYDNANYDIAIKVIKRFCRDNNIKLRFKRPRSRKV